MARPRKNAVKEKSVENVTEQNETASVQESLFDDEKTTVTEEVPKKKTTEKTTKKTFSDSDLIVCKSVTLGGLTICAKSGNVYEFRQYGDECEIEYRDLSELVRRRTSYIYTPRIIITDNDFINEFKTLKDFYNDNYNINDLESVLELPIDEMVIAINNLPPSLKITLSSLAATMVSNGKLDSLRKIKTLDSLFGTDINFLSSLFNE